MSDDRVLHIADPIERPNFGTVVRVAIDRTDGMQTRLVDGEAIWDEHGTRIGIGDVKGALSAGRFIEYATEGRFEPEEADEPWKQEDPGDWHFTVARLYARHVVEVMEVYDTRAEDG